MQIEAKVFVPMHQPGHQNLRILSNLLSSIFNQLHRFYFPQASKKQLISNPIKGISKIGIIAMLGLKAQTKSPASERRKSCYLMETIISSTLRKAFNLRIKVTVTKSIHN